MKNIHEAIQQAKQGDSQAFELIYKECYAPIYRYIHGRTKSREQAEDLTQDVFMKIYRNIGTVTASDHSPLAYFYTIARNTLIDFWRKKGGDTVADDELMSELADSAENPMQNAHTNERSAILYECLEKLTDDQREVITLKFINELSTEEIAEQLGKKETAVRQLQVRGLRSLGKIFKEKYGN